MIDWLSARRPWAARRIVLCIGLFACSGAMQLCACNPSPRGRSGAERPVVVLGPEDLARVEPRVVSVGPRIAGTLEPRSRAMLQAETSGTVIAMRTEVGEKVDAGELLLRIEGRDLDQRMRAARSALRSAGEALEVRRGELQRSSQLLDAGAIPKRQLEQERTALVAAKAQVREAQAQLAALQTEREHTRVRSSISGTVSEQAVHRGDTVLRGQPLLTVIDLSSLRLEATVPAEALSSLAQGTHVEFEVRGRPQEHFRGEIVRIAPAADPISHQIRISIALDNADRRLLAGLYAEGRILDRRKKALAVPFAAVDTTAQGSFATVIRDGYAVRVKLALGLRDPVRELVEVESGLRNGERVVVGPAQELEPGTPIELAAEPADGRTALRGP